jgi:hypothetical protein
MRAIQHVMSDVACNNLFIKVFKINSDIENTEIQMTSLFNPTIRNKTKLHTIKPQLERTNFTNSFLKSAKITSKYRKELLQGKQHKSACVLVKLIAIVNFEVLGLLGVRDGEDVLTALNIVIATL